MPPRPSVSVRRRIHHHVHRLAKFWVRSLFALAGIILAGIISILLGLNTTPSSIPLVNLVRQHPGISLAIGIVLLLLTLVAVVIQRTERAQHEDQGPGVEIALSPSQLLASLAISTISTILFIGLLSTVLVRPSWCPATLCPAAHIVTRQGAINDGTLEMYLTAIESAWYVIPGGPSKYAPGKLPESIGAVQIGTQAGAAPYKVVLGIHSLQQGQFGIIVQDVSLVVVHVSVTPRPLTVWHPGISLDYSSNPYEVNYIGQQTGAVLNAVYTPLPRAHVQLMPGEADDLDIQVVSPVPADVQFRVQVRYRVTNESVLNTLTLPQVFEVIFAPASNWNVYSN